jgi:hypothetical protein
MDAYKSKNAPAKSAAAAGKFAKLVANMRGKAGKNPDALALYVGARRGKGK